MSSLWTPSGEHHVSREETRPKQAAAQPRDEGTGRHEDEARLAELSAQLAKTPAEVVVANHAFGLFELARLHLSLEPPQLPQARLAIDAMAALVDGLGERLGEARRDLAAALSQIRLAFVARQSHPGAVPDKG